VTFWFSTFVMLYLAVFEILRNLFVLAYIVSSLSLHIESTNSMICNHYSHRLVRLPYTTQQ